MTGFLIQVSGHPIEEKADPAYIEGAKGPRYCDEPLQHREYFNAYPFWESESYGRYEAWQTISPGDKGLLYCTSNVDEHGACLSHLLTVDEVNRNKQEGARLKFSSVQELSPKISYSDVQAEIEEDRLSEKMQYCGQEGVNITLIPQSDLDRILDLTQTEETTNTSTNTHPDDSLREIAEDHFGDSQHHSQQNMTDLYSLAKRLKVDDRIILKAVKAEVENQTPKKVTSVHHQEDRICVEAEGPRGGEYAFEVDQDGNHTAYHLHNDGNNEDRGPVGTVKLVWTIE